MKDEFKVTEVPTKELRTKFFNETGIYADDEQIIIWRDNQLKQHPQSREFKSAVEDKRPNVPHYKKGHIEPIDFINSHKLNFNLGNAIKYITRCNFKGTKREDIQKAIDYLNFELEMVEE